MTSNLLVKVISVDIAKQQVFASFKGQPLFLIYDDDEMPEAAISRAMASGGMATFVTTDEEMTLTDDGVPMLKYNRVVTMRPEFLQQHDFSQWNLAPQSHPMQ